MAIVHLHHHRKKEKETTAKTKRGESPLEPKGETESRSQ